MVSHSGCTSCRWLLLSDCTPSSASGEADAKPWWHMRSCLHTGCYGSITTLPLIVHSLPLSVVQYLCRSSFPGCFHINQALLLSLHRLQQCSCVEISLRPPH
jgi:hypothetical protein